MKYIRKEEVEYIKNHGDVLACRFFHPLYPNGKKAYGDCGAVRVNGKDWDIFHVHYETKDAYYGIPMLGLGLVDCMILKSDTRPFLPKELKRHRLGMSGIFSEEYTEIWDIDIKPIVNKL